MAETAEQSRPYSPLENQVMTALSGVVDPELGLDLVNLGLIYDVAVDAAGLCTVTMTLTTMGCPLTDYLHDDITKTVKGVAGINDCKINLTFEPPRTIEMMSRYAKVALGLHG